MLTINGSAAQPSEHGSEYVKAMTDALEVLTEVPGWSLPLAQWKHISKIVGSIEVAAGKADLAALRNATADLLVVSPVRITRIGAEPKVPPPGRIRERVNRLIYSLTGQQPARGTDVDGRRGRGDEYGSSPDR